MVLPGKPKLELRLVTLDSERDRLMEQIRGCEGGQVADDLDHTSLIELRLLSRWLAGGRLCRSAAQRRTSRSKAPAALLPVPPLFDRYSTFRERIERLITISRNATGRPISLREATLRSRYLNAITRMAECLNARSAPGAIRRYVRWSRVAVGSLNQLLRLRFERLRAIRNLYGATDVPRRTSSGF